MSKQLGILFKGEMVRAILEGRKTQTRRGLPEEAMFVASSYIEMGCEQVSGRDENGRAVISFNTPSGQSHVLFSKWAKGDYLYVRETWGVGTRPDPFQGWIDGIEYRADEAYLDEHDLLPINPVAEFDYGSYAKTGWQPSLFMPKIISRIWLKVTNVRVERLLDISEADAIAEGIISHKGVPGEYPSETMYKDYLGTSCVISPIHSYFTLWDSINGAGSHKENGWVWVIEFERCEKP